MEADRFECVEQSKWPFAGEAGSVQPMPPRLFSFSMKQEDKHRVTLENGFDRLVERVGLTAGEVTVAYPMLCIRTSRDVLAGRPPRQRRKGPIEYVGILMRPFAFALTMSLAALATASAQPETPDSENGRYTSRRRCAAARYPHRSSLAVQPERCRNGPKTFLGGKKGWDRKWEKWTPAP